MKFTIFILIALGVSPILLHSQSKQKLNVEGDFYFDTENYIEAEGFYQESADKKNDFKSLYNLANSQEKQEKVEEAMDNYKSAMPFAESDIQRSMAHYNMGNVLLNQKENMDIEKLETIIQHYKDAIRMYPSHSPAKHNLAAAQIALDMAKKQQEQEQQQQQQEQQENQEQQDQDQEQQEQEQEDQGEDQEQKPNQDQKNEAEEKRNQEKKEIDKQEIENILKMVEKEDGEVQQKMRKQTKSDKKDTKKKW